MATARICGARGRDLTTGPIPIFRDDPHLDGTNPAVCAISARACDQIGQLCRPGTLPSASTAVDVRKRSASVCKRAPISVASGPVPMADGGDADAQMIGDAVLLNPKLRRSCASRAPKVSNPGDVDGGR